MTFTSEKPTVPGAYWWRGSICEPILVNVWSSKEKLFGTSQLGTTARVDLYNGEWSPRLVPVDEVEKALSEGFSIGRRYLDSTIEEKEKLFNNSRARRVVDGRDVV